jgi:hypothetical protein
MGDQPAELIAEHKDWPKPRPPPSTAKSTTPTQRMAGLRTNALVATGAALFAMLGSVVKVQQNREKRKVMVCG